MPKFYASIVYDYYRKEVKYCEVYVSKLIVQYDALTELLAHGGVEDTLFGLVFDIEDKKIIKAYALADEQHFITNVNIECGDISKIDTNKLYEVANKRGSEKACELLSKLLIDAVTSNDEDKRKEARESLDRVAKGVKEHLN